MASFIAEEQQINIKIEFYKGSSSTEIFITLQNVCGEQALSQTADFRWIASFNEVRIEAEKKPSPGWPTEVTNAENINKVKEILEKDRWFTCEETA